MTVETVTRRKDLGALASAWDRLVDADPRDGFFRTLGWYQAWLEHIRPDVKPHVIVVRNPEGEICGIAPLCRGIYRDHAFGIRSLFWGGREVVSGDFLDIVCDPKEKRAVVAAVLEFLAANRSLWSLLVLGELVDGSETYGELERIRDREGWIFRRQEERFCPYIELPATFDAYLASLGSSTRYHIRRRIRDVEKKGARVEVFADPQEIVERLPILIDLHLARWRKENLPGTMSRPGFAEFLRRICSVPPANSSCRLYLLTLEGKPAAALIMFFFGESALYYQAGWDPDSPISNLSPAVVLMAHSIQDAIADGRRYYEFLRGDEAYKSRWTKTYRKSSTALVAGRFAGKGYLRVLRLKDAAKARFGRRVVTDPADEAQPDAT